MRSRLSQRTDERKRPRRIDGAVAFLERVTGIEPASPAWKAGALPLCYTRRTTDVQISLKIIAWGMYSVKTIFGNLR